MAASQTKKSKSNSSGKKGSSGSRSNSSSTKRTTQKNVGSGSNRRKEAARTYQNRLVLAVIFLLLTIFSALCWFQLEGIFIDFLAKVERGLVGWGWWSVPLALLLASGQLFFHRGRPVRGRVFCSLMIPVLMGAGAHTLMGTMDLELMKNGVSTLWQLSGSSFTGGVLGGAAAVLLTRVFSRVGAFLVLLVIAVIIAMVLTRVSPDMLVDRAVESHDRRRQEAKKKDGGTRRSWMLPSFDPEPEDEEEDPMEEVPSASRIRSTRKQRIRDYDLEVDDPLTVTPIREETISMEPVGRFQPDLPADGASGAVPARTVSKKRGKRETLFDNQAKVSTPDKYLARMNAEEQLTQQEQKPGKKKKIVPDQQVQEELAQSAAHPVEEYHYPSIELLKKMGGISGAAAGAELKETEGLLSDTLLSFGIEANIVEVTRGPSVTRYELELELGVKLNKVTNLAKDIALSLGAEKVRIAPIPGKNSVVGIEVPNRLVTPVPIRSVIESPEFQKAKSHVAFAVGKDIANRNIVGDIAKMPHLLIAGTTGSGKSVCTNSMIISLLYKSSPEEVRLIMIDPKMVELSNYNGIPHLLIPVVTDPKKAAGALQWAVYEMMQRYQDFANRGVREIESYNAVVAADRESGEKPKPQIVVFIDELADLMIAAGKEVEEAICRVAQMGRAAGMHLVIATQRPSSDVITGLMKANIPSRIALAVASSLDSRIILDQSGAEDLVGNGDMLFAPLGKPKRRVQGCFISDEEVNAVIEEVKRYSTPDYNDDVMKQVEENAKKNEKGGKGGASAMNVTMPDPQESKKEPEDERDPLYYEAVDAVIEVGMASASMIQRRLKVGYARAGRLVDQMEEYGVIGPFEGSKPRKVLISKERWNEIKLRMENQTGLSPDMELARSMSAAADAEVPPFDLDSEE